MPGDCDFLVYCVILYINIYIHKYIYEEKKDLEMSKNVAKHRHQLKYVWLLAILKALDCTLEVIAKNVL